VLLSLVAVFLSVGVVAGDVRDRHVFLVCVKPLGRWQYVVGRWLGVVLLTTALLGASGTAIYVLAQYLRGRSDLEASPEDRRAVETEIFAARSEILPDPPDVTRLVADRIQQKQRDGAWASAVEAYRDQYNLAPAAAAEKLKEDMLKDATAEAQSVGPRRSRSWEFANVRVRGSTRRGRGRVTGVRRDLGLLRVQSQRELVNRLVIFGPVWVNEIPGRVVGRWADGFRAVFSLEDMKSSQMVDLRAGSEVAVAAEPTLQVSYKVSPVDGSAGGNLRAAWKLENPTTGFVYDEPLRDIPANTRVTLIAPSRVVDANGSVRVRYVNYSPSSVMLLNRDVAVLYPVGDFELNFVKTLALMQMGLMFLAALGTFAGSFVSFPVGCLICFAAFPFSVAGSFIGEAIEMLRSGEGPDAFTQFGHYVLLLMRVVLPDLASTLGTTFLVDGLVVPWSHLGWAALLTVFVRGLALLALACLIFHRRELARVQV
jgi:hypothetical protein